MKINKIDHIGIAVSNLDEVKDIYRNIFGLNPDVEENVPSQSVSTFAFNFGGTQLEFLNPTSRNSPISKFLDRRGNAVHHIALQVENLDDALTELLTKGIQLIDKKPRIGAEGKRIAFIHPAATAGILIELSEGENK